MIATPRGAVEIVGRSRRPRPADDGVRRASGRAGWLVAPALLFIAIFFLVPLSVMLARSLLDPSPANYVRFVELSLYVNSLFLTLWMSAVVMVTCLAIGYPYAYAMHKADAKLQLVLSLIVLLPFWSSLLVRTYAWTILLRDTGIINWALMRVGLIDDPLPLMGNKIAVVIGMTHVMLPFMVLPVWASMQRFDRDLAFAASGLGAPPVAIFRRVFLPLTLPGVMAGSIMVFVLGVGFYITPAVLGGRTAFFSLLIVSQISKLLDFGFGSTLGIVLLLVVLAIVSLGLRLLPAPELFGRRAA